MLCTGCTYHVHVVAPIVYDAYMTKATTLQGGLLLGPVQSHSAEGLQYYPTVFLCSLSSLFELLSFAICTGTAEDGLLRCSRQKQFQVQFLIEVHSHSRPSGLNAVVKTRVPPLPCRSSSQMHACHTWYRMVQAVGEATQPYAV